MLGVGLTELASPAVAAAMRRAHRKDLAQLKRLLEHQARSSEESGSAVGRLPGHCCSGLPPDHEGGAAVALTQTWKLPVP
jgi:hypothetical protein